MDSGLTSVPRAARCEYYSDYLSAYLSIIHKTKFYFSSQGYPEFPGWGVFFDMSEMVNVLGHFVEYNEYMETVNDNIDVVMRKEEVAMCGHGMEKYGVEKGASANQFKLMGRFINKQTTN
jgi:hypothetical protein